MHSVSIALATFDGEKYLAPQLESLAGQTTLPAELVICDDCSSDGTIEIARDFAKRAPFPVRIFGNETRLGYRSNFMRAANHCTSELIAFCDQDDTWEPGKIEAMRPLFHDPRVLLAYHNAVVITANGEPAGYLYSPSSAPQTFGPLAVRPWAIVKGFTQMFRRDLARFSHLREQSFDPYWPNEHTAHDQWYLFLASVLGYVVSLPAPLARYRQHSGNVFGWRAKDSMLGTLHHVLRTESVVRSMSRAAKSRVDVLLRLEPQLTGDERASANAAIAYYEGFHRRLEHRIAVYASRSPIARMKALYALIQERAYSGFHGSARLGWDDLFLDAYAGVPFGPLMRRLAR